MPLFRNAILRSPLQVQFDITNKCNFRCLHCYNKSGENEACHDELTDSEVIALFADFAKMRPFNICFCGGEPLLRKELILTVSHKVKGFVPSLSIVTNGYLLDEKVLTQLIDSGINRIQLSIDGITKKTHEYLRGKKESLDRVFLPYEALQYNDINLRSHLFYRMESFYILFDNKNKMNCVIGVMNDFSKTTNIPLLTFISNVQNTDDVSFLLRYLIKTYNESSNKINKIRAVLKFEDIEKIEELLISNSFKLEAKLKEALINSIEN